MPTAELKRMKFGYFVPLREAVGDGPMTDDATQTARVVIITEGLGNLRDRNYYAKTAVQSCADVFNGKQFYIDHPSKLDEENRPERSVRDLAGYFFDTTVGNVQDAETGESLVACFATLKFAESEPGRLAYSQVKTALDYQKRFPNEKDVFCGISINGGGVSHSDTIKGMPVNMVTEIKEAFSADIVTKPARGGKFVAMMKEAQALAKRIGRSRESGDRAIKGDRMNKLNEARKMVADEAKQRMMTGEGLKGIGGKMSRLVAAINQPPEDPDDLIKDIQGDLDALDSLLHDLKQIKKQAEAKRKAAEQEANMAKQDEAKKAAEARRRAAEDERRTDEGEDEKRTDEAEGRRRAGEDERRTDEDERRTDEDEDGFSSDRHSLDDKKNASDNESEDDDEDYGMRSGEDEDGDGDEYPGRDGDVDDAGIADDPGPRKTKGPHDDSTSVGKHEMVPKAASERMKYACETCGSENEVMPPKGFKLARTDEQYATEAQKTLGTLVTRLRRALEAKEARFMEANKDKRNLMQENIKLRARVTAFERMVEAKKVLREAGIPKDILSPMDLLAFEPHQWGTQIKAAKRVLENEAKLVNRGGRGPKDGGVGKAGGDAGADAVAAFRESYKK